MSPKEIVKRFTIVMFALTSVIVAMNYVSDESAEGIYTQYKNTTQKYNNLTASIVADELMKDETTPVPTPPGLQPQPANHEHVSFNQGEEPWGSFWLYDASLEDSGCGACSITAAANYWGIPMEPQEFLPYLESVSPGFIREGWEGDNGMDWDIPGMLVDTLTKDGTYGTFELVRKYQKGSILTNAEFIECCNYLEDPNTVIIVSADEEFFTGGGHIMCIVDYADETKSSFHLMDSSSRSAKILNDIDLRDTCPKPIWEETQKIAWPINDPNTNMKGYIMTNEATYHFKCYWVLRKTS